MKVNSVLSSQGIFTSEVIQGSVEARAFEATGFRGVLGAFELGSVDAPTVSLVGGFTAPAFGDVGTVGSAAVWQNAGTVDDGAGGTISVDVRATVTSVSNAAEIFVGFGTLIGSGFDRVEAAFENEGRNDKTDDKGDESGKSGGMLEKFWHFE